MIRLAIVGSRELTYVQRLTATILTQGLIAIYQGAPAGPEITLVSGGAKGVDAIAERSAQLFGVPTEIYLPESEQWEPSGYKDRNIKIANACDVLWCIRSRYSMTGGSEFTAQQAEKAGKGVYRVWL